jgi:hypothetical protein
MSGLSILYEDIFLTYFPETDRHTDFYETRRNFRDIKKPAT